MLLDEIKDINKERSVNYGHPLPNFLRISMAWCLKKFPVVFSPIDVAELYEIGKDMRNVNITKWDNYRDSMGYVNTIDLMCQLYYDIKSERYKKYDMLTEDMKFYAGEEYKDLEDYDKEKIVNKLKSLTFGEQYDLLIDSVEFLRERKIEGML